MRFIYSTRIIVSLAKKLNDHLLFSRSHVLEKSQFWCIVPFAEGCFLCHINGFNVILSRRESFTPRYLNQSSSSVSSFVHSLIFLSNCIYFLIICTSLVVLSSKYPSN
uniref:Uncharacterized protein n=1 Tax=Glossina brevipalpis TaxID=37001 RepID=A0A1A9WU62_9MUSC